jgi:hypothetical protein
MLKEFLNELKINGKGNYEDCTKIKLRMNKKYQEHALKMYRKV